MQKDRLITLAKACGVDYPYQLEIICEEAKDIIINKARGIGISYAVCFKKLIDALSKKKEITLISASRDQASELMDYVKFFYDKIELEKPHKHQDSANRLSFDNGSKILVLPNSARAMRTYHGDVILDEFAHFEGNDDNVWKAVRGITIRGDGIIVLSTPNGQQGKFYEICEGYKNFKKFKWDYKVCPSKAYQEKVAEIEEDEHPLDFAQEYKCSFLATKESFFPPEVLERQSRHMEEDFADAEVITFGVDIGAYNDLGVIWEIKKVGENFYTPKYITFDAKKEKFKISDIRENVIKEDEEKSAASIYMDATTIGASDAQELEERLGSKFHGEWLTQPFKHRIAMNLYSALDKGIFFIPNDTEVLKHFRNFSRVVNQTGSISYRHSTKRQHDDYVWAAALALEGMRDAGIDCKFNYRIIKREAQNDSGGIRITGASQNGIGRLAQRGMDIKSFLQRQRS